MFGHKEFPAAPIIPNHDISISILSLIENRLVEMAGQRRLAPVAVSKFSTGLPLLMMMIMMMMMKKALMHCTGHNETSPGGTQHDI